MADARTRTTLEFRADAREVAAVDRQLKKTFSGATVRGFNAALKDANTALAKNQEHVAKIVRELAGVKQGSSVWRSMSVDLKEANSEARQLQTALNRINRLQGAGGGRGGSGGASGGGGGSGGPGGARGGRGGYSQLPTPDTAAVATAFGAVPVGGALGAGAYLAGAQAYGAHLQFQQARMQAAPFLMSSSDAMGFRGGGTVSGGGASGGLGSGARNRAIERLTPKAGEALVDATLGAVAGVIDNYTPLGGLNAAMGGDPLRDRVREQARLVGEGRDARLRAGTPSLRDRAAVAGTSAAAGFAETFGASQGMQQTYATVLGRRYTPGRAAYGTGAYTAEGERLGLKPQEALQQAAALAQAAGAPVTGSEFGSAMGIQRTTGVGLGQQGGAVRALRHAGGLGTGQAVQAMADTVASAVSVGLEGSEISGELQKQTAFLQQQADMGVKFDATSILAAQAALTVRSGGAISGYRSGDIARGFAAGGAEVGRRGPKDALDLRMMRAVGFTGEGGAEEYAATRLKMQDPGVIVRALPKLLAQFQGTGLGPEMQTLVTQQVMGRFGAQVGVGEARALSAGVGDIGAFQGGADLQSLRRSARDLTAATGGDLVIEAGIERERIAMGKEAAKGMQTLSRITNDFAGTLQNTVMPLIDTLFGGLEGFSSRLERASQALDRQGPGGSPMLPPKG